MTNLPWYTASANSRTWPGAALARAARSSAELSIRSAEPAPVPTAGGSPAVVGSPAVGGAGSARGSPDPVGREAVGAVAVGESDGAGREGGGVVPATELGRFVLDATSGRDGVGLAATVWNRTS